MPKHRFTHVEGKTCYTNSSPLPAFWLSFLHLSIFVTDRKNLSMLNLFICSERTHISTMKSRYQGARRCVSDEKNNFHKVLTLLNVGNYFAQFHVSLFYLFTAGMKAFGRVLISFFFFIVKWCHWQANISCRHSPIN